MPDIKTTLINYGGGIYAIDQNMVRAFLLVGTNSSLLIDTGAIRTDIVPLIKSVTDLPLSVVLTHSDGDHIGNLQDFSDAFINENDMTAVMSHSQCAGINLHSLTEGQTFDLGGNKLKVLFTPGHTAGSICLLDEERKLLFSGDTVSYGPVYMFGQHRDMTKYTETLKKLSLMKNNGIFNTVYCCHNTCPISADTIDTLIKCADGIINGSVKGEQMPAQYSNNQSLLYKYGECAILF